jgi:GMP synthase (glutamine-hydrolysing)
VLVVDFGAQYSQLIARRIRECRVFSAVVPHDSPPEEILALEPAGLVLSGGPASVYEPGAPALDPRLLELGIPVLGICYGMQAMALAMGGEVARTGAGEFGKTALTVRSRRGMFGDLAAEVCWMSHRDAVAKAPAGFAVTADTPGSPRASMPSSSTPRSCTRPLAPTC